MTLGDSQSYLPMDVQYIYTYSDQINILYDLNIELVSELGKYFGRSHGGAIYFTKKLINL